MSNNLKSVKPDPIEVAADCEEVSNRREENLNYLILFVQEKLKMNEEKILDINPKAITSSAIDAGYTEVEKWGKRLQWLSMIKQQRFIVPRQMKKQAEQTKIAEADAKRLDLEIVEK